MKIFLDSGNIEEIQEALKLNIIDGITTNPSLLAQSEHRSETVDKICKMFNGPVSVEVIAKDFDNMVVQGLAYCISGNNVVIKLPCTEEGIKATKELSSKGYKTNVTLIFNANQAILAAKAGATYCSPFLGRLDDVGQSGTYLAQTISKIFRNYQFNTQIIAASIRSPQQVEECALAGVHIVTMTLKVLKQLYYHPLTNIGLKKFLNDWNKNA